MNIKIKSNSLEDKLFNLFKFRDFRTNQKDIITSLMEGNNVLVIMPTGSGKSLCFQFPSLVSDGLAIIISPLIALMKDQIDAIRKITKFSKAHIINSSLTKRELIQIKKDIYEGKTKILYISPESMAKEEYIDLLKRNKISFFAVDEAHCISEWGSDFRVEYRNIRNFVNKISPNSPLIALTATATLRVQNDIISSLEMKDCKIFKSSFNRPNLFYDVKPKISPDRKIIKYLKDNPNKSGIIYCISRKNVEYISTLLKINSINNVPYHAGLSKRTRTENQEKYLNEQVNVIVATIAFGMGIDKHNVRFIIHYDMPKCLENYYQETGRAGRDGNEAYCLVFYDRTEMNKLRNIIKTRNEDENLLELIESAIGYAETGMPRRKFLLHYFGEDYHKSIENGKKMDDNLTNVKEKINIKEELIFLLKFIKKFNCINNINNTTKLLSEEKTNLKIFNGIEKQYISRIWNALLWEALVNKYLEKNNNYLIKITQKGINFINNPYDTIMLLNKESYIQISSKGSNTKAKNSVINKDLLKILKNYRNRLLREKKINIFSNITDRTLEELCIYTPLKVEKLNNIFGFNNSKIKKFGNEFISIIKQYVEENNIIIDESFTIKNIDNKLNMKVSIIKNIDKKMNLEYIAKSKEISMNKLLDEIEYIVNSGIRININYYIDQILDYYQQDEIISYFNESENTSITDAFEEFEAEYSEEELRMILIKIKSSLN